jgi:hypothetical protein
MVWLTIFSCYCLIAIVVVCAEEAQRAHRQLTGLREQYLAAKQQHRPLPAATTTKEQEQQQEVSEEQEEEQEEELSMTPCGAFMRGIRRGRGRRKQQGGGGEEGGYDSETEFHDKVCMLCCAVLSCVVV